MKDVFDDAYHNFMPTYTNYVLHKPYEGAPDKIFKARSFIVGNIDAIEVDVELSKHSNSHAGIASKGRDDEKDKIEIKRDEHPAENLQSTPANYMQRVTLCNLVYFIYEVYTISNVTISSVELLMFYNGHHANISVLYI